MKKVLAWMIIAGMVAGCLGGCQKPGTKTGESQPPQSQTAGAENKEESQAPAGQDKASGPMGRYGETKVTLPEEIGDQSFISFVKGKGGTMELYTADMDAYLGEVKEAFRYEYRDGSWQKDEQWRGNDGLRERGVSLSYVTYGRDGVYYAGGIDQDYVFRMFRLEEDGSATEILEGEFQPKDGEQYGSIPPKFEVLEDGRIVAYIYWEVNLYDPSGKRLFSMAKDFSGSTGDGRGFCEGDRFSTVHEGRIVTYDLNTGKIVETKDYDEIKRDDEEMVLFGDGEGGMYMANEVGLSHSAKGGTLWEILIDGSLNHMGMRSLTLRGFIQGEQDDYYGVFTSENGGIEMFHYEYDPNLASVPPSVLTVYSLQDQSTVRQAASQFQSDHPDVRVDLRMAAESSGSATEEMIQSLNTELLSGKGADVLILDGLPVQSYIEKGVLMDLRDLVEELESSGDMQNNLLDGFKGEDGAVYQIPARVGFPLLVGEQEALQAYFSLKTMTEYQGETPLMATSNYENLLRKIAHLQYEELFGTRESLTDRETLIRYLECVKTLGEASHSKTAFSEEEMETYWVSNNVITNGITGSATRYDDGGAASGMEHLDGYWSLCIIAEVRNRNPESKLMPAGKIYLPSAIAGINKSTANEELAKEFIRCLMSYEVQKEELYDGLPVNKKAMEAVTEKEHPGFSVGSGYGDYHISAEWPPLKVRQEIASMIGTLTVPAAVDETIMEIIVEGARGYLEDKETVNQAADGILRKLSIYLAE